MRYALQEVALCCRELAPSFGNTTSNGHKQVLLPPSRASALLEQHHTFKSLVPRSKTVLRQASDCPPTPCFAAVGRLLIPIRHSHQPAGQPSRLTQKPPSAPRTPYFKRSGLRESGLQSLASGLSSFFFLKKKEKKPQFSFSARAHHHRHLFCTSLRIANHDFQISR